MIPARCFEVHESYPSEFESSVLPYTGFCEYCGAAIFEDEESRFDEKVGAVIHAHCEEDV